MAKDDDRNAGAEVEDNEETRSLLSQGSEDSDLVVTPGPPPPPKPHPPFPPPRRISSFAQPRPPGTPRTPNRVRFDDEQYVLPTRETNGHADPHEWVEEEDYLTTSAAGDGGRRNSDVQRLPLLTDIEAPSITVASADVGFSHEDLLENARPKSGMRSAFMNMANSIM